MSHKPLLPTAYHRNSIMKARRTMKHKELTQAVIWELSRRLVVTVLDINKVCDIYTISYGLVLRGI